jgi:cytochrome c-type biogenesis protein CcmH
VIAIPIAVFVLLALGAAAFAAGPLFMGSRGRTENREDSFPGRRSRTAQWLLASAIAVFLLGVGGGVYAMLGEPSLALRDVTPPQGRDVKGLIPMLIQRVHGEPNDATAWSYLGRAYMSQSDPRDAAKAYARAIELMRAKKQKDPALYSAYGEALVQQSGGAVSADAEAAFNMALADDPSDAAGRFYLGLARASRGDKEGALALWKSLAEDVPPNSQIHQVLVERMAMLSAQSGGAPDPVAMVARLAARLKTDPNDLMGWQRLVRAYSVLGEPQKAKEALATARKTFASKPDALTALDAAAKELKLN